ncbi:GIY-YIG nuclease family protein [Streptosporangium amethystogenes]|uniref:GIY-YIG nuclease family protein n=1 Tax=Streptosporangium amethystogenes TaxID=2002 RepID=UPI00068F69A2|nr:GIY-YIG nuclease family protein [Streptosporangium amethystogenes]KUJ65413.1 hypothetical protein ACZ90_47920 [Streptomyces albus subsp. albus]
MRTPLLIPAIALSAGSLAWTTWSLVDLLGAGPIGLTVAAGADIIWASVIVAEARGLRIAGYRWPVAAIGWAALLAVGTFLVWHGIARDHTAMAVAGPLLPIGAKLVWLLALADMRDPSALTHDEQAKLAAMERGLRLAEAEHQIELRQRRMTAERLLADVSVDFEIELTRQEKGRELARRAPIAIAPITAEPEAPPVVLSAPAKTSKKQPPVDPAGPDGELVDDVPSLFEGAHAPVVYFLRNGTRVKIGTSQNLRRRVTSLSLRRDDVIRVEHGTQHYERSLHRRFADLRAGDTEWFELRGALAEYLGEPPVEPAEPAAEPEAQRPEPSPPSTALVLASSLATAPEPEAQPANAFGFSAHLTAQSAQRAEAVEKVVELLAQDPGLTSGQVAEALSVSPATAKRYLREARRTA